MTTVNVKCVKQVCMDGDEYDVCFTKGQTYICKINNALFQQELKTIDNAGSEHIIAKFRQNEGPEFDEWFKEHFEIIKN